MYIIHQYNQNFHYNHLYFTSNISNFSKNLDSAMKKGDKLSFKESQKLINLLRETKKDIEIDSNLLGSGYHGKVYKIDNKYVLKIPEFIKVGITAPKKGEKICKELKYYYGNIITKFGDFSILKNLGEHIPVGIPLNMTKTHSLEECNDYFNKKFLPMYANLPQKAFDNIAKDCQALNNMAKNTHNLDYIFDFVNPNNFVIKGKTLYITDDIICNQMHNNGIPDLLRGLLHYKELGSPNVSNESNINLFRNLYKKIILSGIKYDLPLNETYGKCNWEYCTEELCKSKDTTDKVIAKLTHIINNSKDKNTQLKETKKYLNSILI